MRSRGCPCLQQSGLWLPELTAQLCLHAVLTARRALVGRPQQAQSP